MDLRHMQTVRDGLLAERWTGPWIAERRGFAGLVFDGAQALREAGWRVTAGATMATHDAAWRHFATAWQNRVTLHGYVTAAMADQFVHQLPTVCLEGLAMDMTGLDGERYLAASSQLAVLAVGATQIDARNDRIAFWHRDGIVAARRAELCFCDRLRDPYYECTIGVDRSGSHPAYAPAPPGMVALIDAEGQLVCYAPEDDRADQLAQMLNDYVVAPDDGCDVCRDRV